MQDILSRLACIQRPKLLMRAARLGAADYRRDVHLPRLLGYGTLPRHGAALLQLMEMEAELHLQRTQHNAGYLLIQHLDVLIAMVAEARMLKAMQAPEPIVT